MAKTTTTQEPGTGAAEEAAVRAALTMMVEAVEARHTTKEDLAPGGATSPPPTEGAGSEAADAEDGTPVGLLSSTLGCSGVPVRSSREATAVERAATTQAGEAAERRRQQAAGVDMAQRDEESAEEMCLEAGDGGGEGDGLSEALEAMMAASSDEDVVMEGETEWQPSDDEVEVVAVVAPAGPAEERTAGGRARKTRKSAEVASAMIACQLASVREAPRKRRTAAISESEESAEEPFDEMCEVERLVKREERDGVMWYHVKWTDAEPGEEYSWVPAEALAGAASWKAALDRYYDVVLPKEPNLKVAQWLRRDVEVITMGDNSSATCVYEAVRTVMKLQGGAFEIDDAHITEFEQREGMHRVAQGGLRAEQVQRLFEFLIGKGWRVHLKANVYGVHVNQTGPAGILLAVDMKPGIYLVATLDELFRGHCFVTEVNDSMMALVYEDGVEMGLGEYRYAKKICWIRECVMADGEGLCEGDEAGGDAETGQVTLGRAPMARKPAKGRNSTKAPRRKRKNHTPGKKTTGMKKKRRRRSGPASG
ncbi:unnamed protein product [Peronospora farinosa]|uniref:Chromo domain-containing protein n=1 Tax=Peronospora farinosa TaxID=134698 RepID=A0ABN8CIS9_9STRA|nr:unnamed protein product [Peronospora farinosa]